MITTYDIYIQKIKCKTIKEFYNQSLSFVSWLLDESVKNGWMGTIDVYPSESDIETYEHYIFNRNDVNITTYIKDIVNSTETILRIEW